MTGEELGPMQHNVGGAEAFHPDPSNRLATIHQRYRETGQWSNRIGRTFLQMVAQSAHPLGDLHHARYRSLRTVNTFFHSSLQCVQYFRMGRTFTLKMSLSHGPTYSVCYDRLHLRT